MWNIMHHEKSLISIFQEFCASINKTFILTTTLGTRVSFYEVLTVPWYFLISTDPKSQVVRQVVRQLEYTMFISNNHPLFNLWWNKNLVKHRKVSKYYETYCLHDFIFLFMFLLTIKKAKNSPIDTTIFSIFLINVLEQTWNSFNTKSITHWKRSEKQLPSMANFRTGLPLNWSKFRRKQCERPYS